MSNRETLKHHAGLVDQMATRVGIDLEDAALRGDVSIDEISEAVLRCTGCANPGHCEALLAQVAVSQDTPEYCRNKGLFAQIKPRKGR
ncbi:DUF6455 family protein [Ruegeria lacuscaerulensis]|uniref:DUF6455 family protein n=1 Tax=Ruegeria lacuscaerulensis TaxID=55218 RepID=UPI00147B612E|nr:DUF6455 family protein [Ruegeria lacuscaerulensis]